jgi:hypothetical protein
VRELIERDLRNIKWDKQTEREMKRRKRVKDRKLEREREGQKERVIEKRERSRLSDRV